MLKKENLKQKNYKEREIYFYNSNEYFNATGFELEFLMNKDPKNRRKLIYFEDTPLNKSIKEGDSFVKLRSYKTLSILYKNTREDTESCKVAFKTLEEFAYMSDEEMEKYDMIIEILEAKKIDTYEKIIVKKEYSREIKRILKYDQGLFNRHKDFISKLYNWGDIIKSSDGSESCLSGIKKAIQ